MIGAARWLVLPCLSMLLGALAAHAQPRIGIKDVRVGFPYGPQIDWYKAGTWVPVLVTVGPPIDRTTGSVALAGDFSAELKVSTNDGDGARAIFAGIPISIKREEITRERPDRTFVSYIKVASITNEIRIELENARINERSEFIRPFEYPSDLPNGRNQGVESDMAIFANLGRTVGLEPRGTDNDPDRTDSRAFRLATVTRLEELPTNWFGYQSLDAFILPTGGTWAGSLAQSLANDATRRVALEQWVAQGGHLVVCVGSNASIVANRQSFPLEPLLPATVDPAATIKSTRLEALRAYLEQNVPESLRRKARERVKGIVSEIVKLTPRGSGFPLIGEQNGQVPVVVRGNYGLGRVTLVGFDVSSEAFNSWENNQDFWTAILEMKGVKERGQRNFGFGGNAYNTSGTLSERLGNELETFGDVAVVSFFWVAIFILIYVIIIGPVDYFFLKKVVKRLELTWITFPAIVLLVSLAAYFGAYWLKGDELRLNKVDVIDVDQTHGLTVGTTWFSVFSPRLQSYEFRLEPVGVGQPREGTALSWFARDGFAFRGIERQGTDLFQREYLLADNGSALKDVPIQVWAMKTFTGRWHARLEGQAPILSTLRGANSLLSGTVTSRLPGPLGDCWLIYRNNLYRLGTLKPNETTRVPVENQGMNRQLALFSPMNRQSSSGQALANYAATVGRAMFFRFFSQDSTVNDTNELLTYLDQTRRLNSEEAILLGQLEDTSGTAAELNEGIRFGTKLRSPQLRGTLRQVTFVRVYLPVRATDSK